MKNVITVIKKELMRFFKEPRMLIALLLPGVLIYAIYSFMGSAVSNEFGGSDEYIVYAEGEIPSDFIDFVEMEKGKAQVNLNELEAQELAELESYINSLKNYINFLNILIDTPQATADMDGMIEKIKSGEVHLLIEFEDGFMEKLEAYIPKPEENQPPLLTVYYNPANATSSTANSWLSSVVTSFRLEQQPDPFITVSWQEYDEAKEQARFFAMFLPLILISFLFSGCMGVAPESIAGEKERGTLATILVTPIKRSELAIGKISALSVIAILSAISSFIGIILSLPKLMGDAAAVNIYGVGEFMLVFLILISTVLIIIGAMSLISCFAKSVKEATMLITPFMILSMLLGLTSMMSDGANTSTAAYLIPIYNSVQSLVSILNFEVNIGNLVVTFAANMVCVGVCVFALAKIFNNEKIMFSK